MSGGLVLPGFPVFRLPRVAVALAVLAALNLAAGVWLSRAPARLADLEQIVAWAGAWRAGDNPYARAESIVDYPPWALVMLSPLAAVPAGMRPPLWIAVNVVLTFVLAGRLAQSTGEAARVRVALMLLLAATAAARTLTQFSLLSFALAAAGVLSAHRTRAPLAVGLALMKPQIGGIAWLVLLLSRRWGAALGALVVPGALLLLFATRLNADPLSVISQYVRTLSWVHGAWPPIEGNTELRAWLVQLAPAAADLTVSVALASILLLPALHAARRRSSWDNDARLELLSFCGVVSLLAVRHLSYDFIVLWPALVAWRTPPLAAVSRPPAVAVAFWTFAAALVLGLPGWVRAAVATGLPSELRALTETDRLLAVAAWGWLARRLVVPAGDLK